MTSNPNLEAALRLVSEGFAVFPCRPDKTPHVKFLESSTRNEGIVYSWWEKWPDALPALPCGVNGLCVVDCDRKDGVDGVASFHAGCVASAIALDDTFTVDTPSGGKHYYFRADGGIDIGNTVCKLGPGIDTRGAGGYVIAPHAVLPDGRAYRPVQGALRGIVALPAAIREVLEKPTQPQEAVIVDPALVTRSDRAYAKAALRKECNKVSKTLKGARSSALNSAAYSLGMLVANGTLNEADVVSALRDAAKVNGHIAEDGEIAVMKTIDSGLREGKGKPRPLPSQTIPPLTPEFLSHLEQKGQAAKRAAAQLQAAIPSTPVSTAAIADIDAIPSVFAYTSASIEFAVHNIVAYSAITLISGDAGCGKTTLITAMASHVANGTSFLGHTATQLRKVLYLDRENSLPIVQERLRRLRVTDGANLKYFGAHVGDVPLPGSPIVKAWVQRTEPKPVVFVDSLSAFMEGNENSAEDIRRFMQQLRDLATLGAAVVILHHVGKGENAQEYRGSTDIKAAIDVGFILRNFGETRLSKLALKPFKARFTVTDTMAISYERGEFIAENAPQAGDDGLTELLRANPELKKMEFEALASKRGFKRSHIRSFIVSGLQSGLIRSMTGEHNAQSIALAESMSPGRLFS